MKIVKFLFKLTAFVIVLAVAALLATPLWFGPVAKTVANATVPGIVKTDFRVGHLSLNPYTARLEFGDLILGNPRGYLVNDAVRVGEVVFDAETLSLMTDVIHIEEITVRDLFVSVVTGGQTGTMNFKQLQYDVAGGREKYEAARTEKAAKAASAQEPRATKPDSNGTASSKRVIIDRLEISGLTLQLSILPIRIPTAIVLTNIGRETCGVTLEQAWQQVLEAVMKYAGVTGDQIKLLNALSVNAAKGVGVSVSKTTGRATTVVSSTVGAATGVAEGAVGAATGVVNGSARAVDDSAKAVGEGAKKMAESLRGLLKKGAK